jgi:hypothetical protein
MTLTLLPGGSRDPTTDAFRAQIERFRRPDRDKRKGPNPEQEQEQDAEVLLAPASAYEMVTRQMVESIAEDVRDIKGKITNLIFVLAGAVVLDIVSRALGG